MAMEQKSFQLEITTPTSSQEATIEWIEVESPTGSFLVGPDHSHLISIIKNKSSITYKKVDTQIMSHDVTSGIFSIIDNKAIVLLDE